MCVNSLLDGLQIPAIKHSFHKITDLFLHYMYYKQYTIYLYTL